MSSSPMMLGQGEAKMIDRHGALRAAIAVAFALAVPLPVLSQGYGLGDQVLEVGAASFRSVMSTDSSYFGLDGYLYAITGNHQFVAPLELPNGALIVSVCVQGSVLEAGFIEPTLEAIQLVDTGQLPGIIPVEGTDVADLTSGYKTVCSGPVSYTVHTSADLDGNGVRNLSHRVFMNVSGGNGFGGVQIVWRRQVSTAPATATFSDVRRRTEPSSSWKRSWPPA